MFLPVTLLLKCEYIVCTLMQRGYSHYVIMIQSCFHSNGNCLFVNTSIIITHGTSGNCSRINIIKCYMCLNDCHQICLEHNYINTCTQLISPMSVQASFDFATKVYTGPLIGSFDFSLNQRFSSPYLHFYNRLLVYAYMYIRIGQEDIS